MIDWTKNAKRSICLMCRIIYCTGCWVHFETKSLNKVNRNKLVVKQTLMEKQNPSTLHIGMELLSEDCRKFLNFFRYNTLSLYLLQKKSILLHQALSSNWYVFCGSNRLMLVPHVIRLAFGSGANSHSLFSYIIYWSSAAMSAALASTVGLQSIVRNWISRIQSAFGISSGFLMRGPIDYSG